MNIEIDNNIKNNTALLIPVSVSIFQMIKHKSQNLNASNVKLKS